MHLTIKRLPDLLTEGIGLLNEQILQIHSTSPNDHQI